MTTYVRAARYATADPAEHRTRVTGTVLHLSTWAPDAPGDSLVPGSGRWVPLCVRPSSHVQRWEITGPGITGWDGHAHWPVCQWCARTLDGLLSDLNAQDDRHDAHARPAPEHTPVWLGVDCRDGKHAACSAQAWDEHLDCPTGCACCLTEHNLTPPAPTERTPT